MVFISVSNDWLLFSVFNNRRIWRGCWVEIDKWVVVHWKSVCIWLREDVDIKSLAHGFSIFLLELRTKQFTLAFLWVRNDSWFQSIANLFTFLLYQMREKSRVTKNSLIFVRTLLQHLLVHLLLQFGRENLYFG